MSSIDWKCLFKESIWTVDTKDAPRWWRVIVRFVKLCRITISTFMENNMGVQCVAMSYFVALAAVPFFALLFTITGGVGLSDKLSDMLHLWFSSYPEVIDLITATTDNLIGIAQSGIVGLISALVFFWTVIWMIFQVERIFNHVWGINKIPRKLYKRFSFYLLVIFLSPFLILIFGSGIALYVNIPTFFNLRINEIRFLTRLLAWFSLYVLSVFTFSVMYKFIPATYVRYKFAFKSALLSGLVFTVFQYLYLEAQVFVGRLSAVYGVMAAIPLFLIWLNFSWQIIIYGAQLTYGYQNVETYHIPEWDDDDKTRK